MAIARDKFWLFGVRAHQDDCWFGPCTKKETRRKFQYSRITPAEGAFILDIPNVIMVVCDGEPANFSHDAYGYAESFYRMKQVQWSVTGSDGFCSGNEEAFICKLAEDYPNITGIYLDDFFGSPEMKASGSQEEIDRLAKEKLEQISKNLEAAPRPLDIHMVYYTRNMGESDPSVFDKVTTLSMWTWRSEELPLLQEKFETMESWFPDKKKMIGIYMFDFPAGRSIPIELMEHQCNFALQMLKEGRIDGIIFEANSTMGMRMESELWLRQWIEKHKFDEVPDSVL